MKLVVLAVLAALVPGVTAAQYYQPYRPYGSQPSQQQQTEQPPRSGYTYDPQSGNSYSWRRDSSGNTNVQGSNLQTGSMWNSTIRPNGNQTGFDSQGNYWSYDARSGNYINSNGKMCTGQGAARICN